MSNIAKDARQQGNYIKFGDKEEAKEPIPKLNVKDTDFLLKLMMESSFKGVQLELAYNCMKTLAQIHKRFLNEN